MDATRVLDPKKVFEEFYKSDGPEQNDEEDALYESHAFLRAQLEDHAAQAASSNNNSESIFTINETDVKLFLHVLAFAYTGQKRVLMPDFVGLAGITPYGRLSLHFLHKGTYLSPGSGPKPATKDQILFPARLAALARKVGMDVANFNAEVLCEHVELTYKYATWQERRGPEDLPSDNERSNLLLIALLYFGASGECPGKFKQAFEKVPDFYDDYIECWFGDKLRSNPDIDMRVRDLPKFKQLKAIMAEFKKIEANRNVGQDYA
ncbi:hypothetical protein ABW21_db0200364 [Orbilia brochopaga]|nr:hypothetical protein ABW21_db0200364 [Drechslerella brochopaga]